MSKRSTKQPSRGWGVVQGREIPFRLGELGGFVEEAHLKKGETFCLEERA